MYELSVESTVGAKPLFVTLSHAHKSSTVLLQQQSQLVKQDLRLRKHLCNTITSQQNALTEQKGDIDIPESNACCSWRPCVGISEDY